MTQNTQRKNQDISCDVIRTTNVPSPVITIEGRKMVSHRFPQEVLS